MALTSCPLYLLNCLCSCCLLLLNCLTLFPECALHVHTFVPFPILFAQASLLLPFSLLSDIRGIFLVLPQILPLAQSMLFLNVTKWMPFLFLIVLEIKINCKFLENKDHFTPHSAKHRTVKTRGNEYLCNSNCDRVFSLFWKLGVGVGVQVGVGAQKILVLGDCLKQQGRCCGKTVPMQSEDAQLLWEPASVLTHHVLHSDKGCQWMANCGPKTCRFSKELLSHIAPVYRKPGSGERGYFHFWSLLATILK